MALNLARRAIRALARRLGYEVTRARPAVSTVAADTPPDMVTVPKYLAPSGHKLIDFRQEPGFCELAQQVISDGRTLLDFNRLLTLWHAVRNVRALRLATAEVGTYQGGSAWFIAAALQYWELAVPLHVIDTFSGHPDVIEPELDGPHTTGTFADTSLPAVQQYLSEFQSVEIHPGEFAEVAPRLADRWFGLVHLDVDLYQSAVAALEFFWPRLAVGGCIVVDDYGFTTCRGMKLAVDTFVNQSSDCAIWYVHTGQLVMAKRAEGI